MAVTVARHLVAGIVYTTDQRGRFFRNPAKGKKGGFRVVITQYGKKTVGIGLNPIFHIVPVFPVDGFGERGYLEIIFYIDRKCVTDGVHES
jgi:hypothetical protein